MIFFSFFLFLLPFPGDRGQVVVGRLWQISWGAARWWQEKCPAGYPQQQYKGQAGKGPQQELDQHEQQRWQTVNRK